MDSVTLCRMPDSGDEFASADYTDSESGVENTRRKTKQQSISTMMKQHGLERQAKRRLPDNSPPGASPSPPAVQLDDNTLRVLENMIQRCNASMVAAFEAKFERMERRIHVIEGEAHDRDQRIQLLEAELQRQGQINQQLHEQVQAMDMNGRLASLVITCDDFKPRRQSEAVDRIAVDVLNARIQDLNMSVSDLHAAHRLQKDDKIICKFTRRQTRDFIYDSRFRMSRHELDSNGRRTRELKPCYITESLTDSNKLIYNELLQARRPQNGNLVASVFTRRGVVYCRAVKGGDNIRVPDQVTLRRVLGGAHFTPPSRRGGDRVAPERRPSPPPRSAPLSAPLLGPPARPGEGGAAGPPGDGRGAAPPPRQSAAASRAAGSAGVRGAEPGGAGAVTSEAGGDVCSAPSGGAAAENGKVK